MTKQPVPGLHENFSEEAAMSADKARVTDAMVEAGVEEIRKARHQGFDRWTDHEAIRAALSAALAQAEQPVAWQWCAYENGAQYTSWYPDGYGDRAGWEALARRNPGKYQVVTRPLYAHPPAKREAVDALTAAAQEFVERAQVAFLWTTEGAREGEVNRFREAYWKLVHELSVSEAAKREAGETEAAGTPAPSPILIGCEDGDIPCDRCSGTGNLIKDWDRYVSAKTTEEIEDCESDCPDCSGYGRFKDETPAPQTNVVGGETIEFTLRAMAQNYSGGHSWDHLDSEACLKAADEIQMLRAGIKRLSDEEELCAEYTGDDPFSMVYLAAKLQASDVELDIRTKELDQTLADFRALRVSAQDVIASASDTYKKRNGHLASFEDDSGEKCWIVPFDAFEGLRSAVAALAPEGSDNG